MEGRVRTFLVLSTGNLDKWESRKSKGEKREKGKIPATIPKDTLNFE